MMKEENKDSGDVLVKAVALYRVLRIYVLSITHVSYQYWQPQLTSETRQHPGDCDSQ